MLASPAGGQEIMELWRNSHARQIITPGLYSKRH
jgi:hypothetical protein